MKDLTMNGWPLEVMNSEQFAAKHPDLAEERFYKHNLLNISFCKAERFPKGLFGTLAIPQKLHPAGKKVCLGYFMDEDSLTFIDEGTYAETMIENTMKYIEDKDDSPRSFLFHCLEYLLVDDVVYLQKYEEKLEHLESVLIEKDVSDFNHKILSARKDLSALNAYYEQLSDMGEILEEYAHRQSDEVCAHLFHVFSARADRLYSTVQTLKEYSMQLREMHQTQVDMRQNEIMQFLTVVTTIFMPLTLITGWYGMNFAHMPELQARYGYIIICVICVVILIAEFIIFKKKKWFK